MTVVVSYTATDNLVHHDNLMIDADHQLQSTEFDLQAVQLSSADISELPYAIVTVSVTPNPASNFVKVDMCGMQNADIQVIDLLGKTVASAKSNSTWRWDASNVTAGTYIVRVSGETLNYEHIVNSQRVVLTK